MSLLRLATLSFTMLLLSSVNAVAGFGGNSSDFMGALALGLGMMVAVFLVFREFFCWYWKINQRIGLMENLVEVQRDIRTKLQKLQDSGSEGSAKADLTAKSEGEAIEARKARVASLKDRKFCPSCYRDYSEYILTCEACGLPLEG